MFKFLFHKLIRNNSHLYVKTLITDRCHGIKVKVLQTTVGKFFAVFYGCLTFFYWWRFLYVTLVKLTNVIQEEVFEITEKFLVITGKLSQEQQVTILNNFTKNNTTINESTKYKNICLSRNCKGKRQKEKLCTNKTFQELGIITSQALTSVFKKSHVTLLTEVFENSI